MVGDMDYKKIRNSETTLTEKEIGYCINDVKVVDTISRQAAIDVVKGIDRSFVKYIEELPSAQPYDAESEDKALRGEG